MKIFNLEHNHIVQARQGWSNIYILIFSFNPIFHLILHFRSNFQPSKQPTAQNSKRFQFSKILKAGLFVSSNKFDNLLEYVASKEK